MNLRTRKHVVAAGETPVAPTRRCSRKACSLRGAVSALLAVCMGGFALEASAATETSPTFHEVFSLVQSNLAGTTPGQLDQMAVEGFLLELSPRVLLVTNANASVLQGKPTGVLDARIYRQHVGYIRLGVIGQGTSEQLHTRYEELSASNRLYGLVLDLRGASGDDYAAALQVANLFLAHEVPLLNWGEGLKSSAENKAAITVPVAVLVNDQTGGAAEALAGMLRQSGVALLIGSRTAGTAGIQRAFPLPNGLFLKITVANIQLGNAQMLPATGLKPDVEVAARPTQDATLASNLSGQSANAEGETEVDTNATTARVGMNEADLVRRWRGEMLSAKDLEVPSTEIGPESHDPALLRALDLMEGLAILRSWQK